MHPNQPEPHNLIQPSTGTLQQQAYISIKRRILNRVYKPGQALFDTQLAEELGISRTPVREALRALEQEGLLVSQARQGWKVYSLSLDDIHEIFELKMAVEGMLARNAARCTDEDKRTALKTEMDKMLAAVAAGDFELWREADHGLHQALFAMEPNERACRFVENLNEQWYRLRIGFLALEGRMQRSTQEHAPIVQGILKGDGDAAERSMRIHIENVRQELVGLLVNMVLPFTEGIV